MPNDKKKVSTKNADSVLMYCSFFTYGKDQASHRKAACEMKVDQIVSKFTEIESKCFSN